MSVMKMMMIKRGRERGLRAGLTAIFVAAPAIP